MKKRMMTKGCGKYACLIKKRISNVKNVIWIFDDPVRLEIHFKAAHPAKHDGFRPKWYWET